jgi:hypothetical protein
MMKTFSKLIILVLVMICIAEVAQPQTNPDSTVSIQKVVKQNGVAFTGKIVFQDAREVLVDSKEMGLVYIPRHEIKEIVEIKWADRAANGSLFATRYFLTTNGFPIKKGDNYIQWNLFGPDFQFGIADNFGVGIMTSWVGMPIIGTAKYSIKLGKDLCGGLGFLAGTGSWAFPKYGLLLPFGFLTVGNRMNNLNFSAGYGALFQEKTVYGYTLVNTPTDYSTNSVTTNSKNISDSDGRFLWSIAGMFRLNKKFSFVFDSFFMLLGRVFSEQVLRETRNQETGKNTFSIENELIRPSGLFVLCPGLRFQASENSSFQFGFTGVHSGGEFVQFPIPMVQWFRKI